MVLSTGEGAAVVVTEMKAFVVRDIEVYYARIRDTMDVNAPRKSGVLTFAESMAKSSVACAGNHMVVCTLAGSGTRYL